MAIAIDPQVEARLQEKAVAEGLTISAYIQRLVRIEDAAEAELETLALAGLSSGECIPGDDAFWQQWYERVERH